LAEGELATDKLLDKMCDYKQIRPRIMPPCNALVKGDCISKLAGANFFPLPAGDLFALAPYTRGLYGPLIVGWSILGVLVASC
jgi:hypothetical protein